SKNELDTCYLELEPGKAPSSKLQVQSSYLIVRTFVIVESNLVLVGPVLEVPAICREADAPPWCNHLAAHFVFARGAERRIRKIGVFYGWLSDLIFADSQPTG